ncbi:hypothetical protein BDV32DRAFT_11665 [Aspergillus pseudonomiae]|nr:hypothetical protein BDV32DRAFT_11665 [Aspergillus pseudonomiae]
MHVVQGVDLAERRKYACDGWGVDNFASHMRLINCGTKIAVLEEEEATNKARVSVLKKEKKKKKKVDGRATLHPICVDSMTLTSSSFPLSLSLSLWVTVGPWLIRNPEPLPYRIQTTYNACTEFHWCVQGVLAGQTLQPGACHPGANGQASQGWKARRSFVWVSLASRSDPSLSRARKHGPGCLSLKSLKRTRLGRPCAPLSG